MQYFEPSFEKFGERSLKYATQGQEKRQKEDTDESCLGGRGAQSVAPAPAASRSC